MSFQVVAAAAAGVARARRRWQIVRVGLGVKNSAYDSYLLSGRQESIDEQPEEQIAEDADALAAHSIGQLAQHDQRRSDDNRGHQMPDTSDEQPSRVELFAARLGVAGSDASGKGLSIKLGHSGKLSVVVVGGSVFVSGVREPANGVSSSLERCLPVALGNCCSLTIRGRS